jgi:hypothetical protein
VAGKGLDVEIDDLVFAARLRQIDAQIMIGKCDASIAHRDGAHTPADKALAEGEILFRREFAQHPIALLAELHGNLTGESRRFRAGTL